MTDEDLVELRNVPNQATADWIDLQWWADHKCRLLHSWVLA